MVGWVGGRRGEGGGGQRVGKAGGGVGREYGGGNRRKGAVRERSGEGWRCVRGDGVRRYKRTGAGEEGWKTRLGREKDGGCCKGKM